MPTPIQPDNLARAAGYDPVDFVEAVQTGEDDFAGLPIGSWRQNGGEYLSVPDDYASQLGFDPENSRSNPGSDLIEEARGTLAGRDQGQAPGGGIADAAPPVSANAGAAYAAGQFADTVREQPQIMGDVADVAALLGSAGLAYATAKEGQVLKAGATAGGLFAAFKGLRYICEQGDRKTDMAERQQRHQIQQQREQQRPKSLPEQGSSKLNGAQDDPERTISLQGA
jgi:hypothetical protein